MMIVVLRGSVSYKKCEDLQGPVTWIHAFALKEAWKGLDPYLWTQMQPAIWGPWFWGETHEKLKNCKRDRFTGIDMHVHTAHGLSVLCTPFFIQPNLCSTPLLSPASFPSPSIPQPNLPVYSAFSSLHCSVLAKAQRDERALELSVLFKKDKRPCGLTIMGPYSLHFRREGLGMRNQKLCWHEGTFSRAQRSPQVSGWQPQR